MKHRFMSVGFLFQRGAAYAVATIIVLFSFSLVAVLSEIFLQPLIGYWDIIITALAALALAILYAPLVRGFEKVTDRLFFRGRYDYQKILRKISYEIASVIKLEQLAKLVVAACSETMKIAEISFLLPDKDGGHFRSVPLAAPCLSVCAAMDFVEGMSPALPGRLVTSFCRPFESWAVRWPALLRPASWRVRAW